MCLWFTWLLCSPWTTCFLIVVKIYIFLGQESSLFKIFKVGSCTKTKVCSWILPSTIRYFSEVIHQVVVCDSRSSQLFLAPVMRRCKTWHYILIPNPCASDPFASNWAKQSCSVETAPNMQIDSLWALFILVISFWVEFILSTLTY